MVLFRPNNITGGSDAPEHSYHYIMIERDSVFSITLFSPYAVARTSGDLMGYWLFRLTGTSSASS